MNRPRLTPHQMTFLDEPFTPPDRLPPSQKHSPTSRAAAVHLEVSGKRETQEALAARLFREVAPEGLTDVELDDHARMFGFRGPTLRPRRIKLWHKGFVHAVPNLTRKNPGGHTAAQVWAWTGREYPGQG